MTKKTLFIFILSSLLYSCNKKPQVTILSSQKEEKIDIGADSMKNLTQNIKTKQNEVLLEILSPSVRVNHDTLYFKYKVINNSSRNLFFYHLQLLSFSLELNTDTQYDFPKCNVIITDMEGNIPILISRMGKPEKYESPEFSLNSFISLKSNNRKLFERRFYIGDLVLNSTEYKFRLQYYSPYNEYYFNRFEKKKKQTIKFKEYDLFEGILESNSCPFKVYK